MTQEVLNSFKNKKIGLVMSGGVVKAAAWHLGVSLALEELGFRLGGFNKVREKDDELNINTYVGSSAGAMISTYFANGFSPHEIIDATIGKKGKLRAVGYKDMLYLKRPDIKTKKPEFFDPLEGFPYLIKKIVKPFLSTSGFFSTEGLRKYLIEHVLKAEDFDGLDVDLFVVATQLDSSKKVIFSKYNYPNPTHDSTSHYYTDTKISDAVAASMAVPPFYTPFPIKNERTGDVDYYIDGEIRDTLSTHVAIDNNCEIIISSWTHTPYHFHDEIGSLAHYGIPSIAIQSIFLMIQKKIVTARAQFKTAEDLLKTVHSYMKTENFSERHSKEIIRILESKLSYKGNLKFIDIYPDHKDYRTFFTNQFSLESDAMALVIRQGYKKTMQVFNDLSEV